MGEIEKNDNFYKEVKKKIKTIRTKLKNIIPSIWIELNDEIENH